MADTGEGKKEEADYKRLHSFPLIRVRMEMKKDDIFRIRKYRNLMPFLYLKFATKSNQKSERKDGENYR